MIKSNRASGITKYLVFSMKICSRSMHELLPSCLRVTARKSIWTFRVCSLAIIKLPQRNVHNPVTTVYWAAIFGLWYFIRTLAYCKVSNFFDVQLIAINEQEFCHHFTLQFYIVIIPCIRIFLIPRKMNNYNLYTILFEFWDKTLNAIEISSRCACKINNIEVKPLYSQRAISKKHSLGLCEDAKDRNYHVAESEFSM